MRFVSVCCSAQYKMLHCNGRLKLTPQRMMITLKLHGSARYELCSIPKKLCSFLSFTLLTFRDS